MLRVLPRNQAEQLEQAQDRLATLQNNLEELVSKWRRDADEMEEWRDVHDCGLHNWYTARIRALRQAAEQLEMVARYKETMFY